MTVCLLSRLLIGPLTSFNWSIDIFGQWLIELNWSCCYVNVTKAKNCCFFGRHPFHPRKLDFPGKILISLLLITIASICCVEEVQPHCIWYGVCYEDDDDRSFNCPSNETGKILPDKKAQDLLLKLCPDIYGSSKLFFALHD